MSQRIVTEGEAFDVSEADHLFLSDLLGGFVEHRRDGQTTIHRMVGQLRLPSGTAISIRSPKAPATSVLAWLAYVDASLAPLLLLDDVELAAFDGDVVVLSVLLLLTELRRALQRHGIPRAYAHAQTWSSAVRGRIEFERLLRRGGDLSRLPCAVWERTPCGPTVRTIAAALAMITADEALRRISPADLRACVSAFADVEPVADADLLSGKSGPARSELGFARALGFACLLLRSNWLASGSTARGPGYLVNLDALFESAVVRALGLVDRETRAKRPVAYERVGSAKTSMLQGMEMDAHCPSLGARGIVVDAKFRRAVSSQSLQQVLTYCFVTGSEEAVLVFPRGFVTDKRPFVFRSPFARRSIRVHIAELDTTGRSLAAWRAAGAEMAEAIRRTVQPSPHVPAIRRDSTLVREA